MVSAALVSGPLPAAVPNQGAKAVEALVEPYAQKRGPGCALALSRNGERLVSHAFGLANLEHDAANSPDTIFEAASASKQMTAAAVLLLVSDGKLALDDDVRRYLPELPDYGETITIDHLLTHQSGLRDWRYLIGIAGAPPGARVNSNLDALKIASWQRGLNHASGEEFAYTNTGYSLAAIIVERVSGETLAEFSRKRLFEPLGMASTHWRDDHRRIVAGRATAYSPVSGGMVADMPFENAYGSGGLLTTVGDLLAWNEALRTGGLGPEVSRKLEEVPVLGDGQRSPYARGLYVGQHRGTREIGHGGVSGGYRAWTGRYPQHGIAVAVLCNSAVNPAQIARGLADLYLPAEALMLPANTAGPPMASRIAAPVDINQPRWRPDAAALAELAGNYSSDELRAAFTAQVERGALVLRLDGLSDQRWVLSPTFRDRFVFSHGTIEVVRKAGQPCQLLLNLERLRDFPLSKNGCARSGD